MNMNDTDLRFTARWTTRKAARIANISEPTVRKYAQVLSRECNYHFHTVNGRERRYSDHDITLFIEMKRLSDDTGMDVTKVAQIVYAKFCNLDDDSQEFETGYVSDGDVMQSVFPSQRDDNVEDHTIQTVSTNNALSQGAYSDDLSAIVARASRQFWQAAHEEIVQDVREAVREEVRTELNSGLADIKRHVSDELQAAREEAAASYERKPWWKFGR
ncbi:MerR family transcriptional regulator [Alicyclobacillus curvatus]|nr:MerR family transcriptional regulator [Alicyclobacillus curvatus]